MGYFSQILFNFHLIIDIYWVFLIISIRSYIYIDRYYLTDFITLYHNLDEPLIKIKNYLKLIESLFLSFLILYLYGLIL